jgi:hypothetical protein
MTARSASCAWNSVTVIVSAGLFDRDVFSIPHPCLRGTRSPAEGLTE